MPSVCPHCQAETADRNSLCTHCGKSALFDVVQSRSPENALQESDRRFPVWKILPWTILAAAALLLLPHLRPRQAPVTKPTSRPAPAVTASRPAPIVPPAAVPAGLAQSVAAIPAPAETPRAAQVPLTVTLDSAGSGRHVPAGVPVMISAFAALAPGQSATLTVSYAKDDGPKSLLSLTQGSLSSTAWTPLAPGHYTFTASALDSRKSSAFSRHLSLWVDAPAPVHAPPSRVAAARPAPEAKPLPKAEPARVPPVPVAAKRTAPARLAVKPALPIRAAVKPAPLKPAAPSPYHVAAASFPVRPVAETLAGALRRRGFNALVRVSAKGQGKPTYTVETGDYFSRADARKQMRLLLRDGYPAYLFRIRPQ